MSRISKLESIYEARKPYTYKGSTINAKELDNAVADLRDKKEIYLNAELAAEDARNGISKSSFVNDEDFTDIDRSVFISDPNNTEDDYINYVKDGKREQKREYAKARHLAYRGIIGDTKREYASAKRLVDKLQSMLTTSYRQETPSSPPTLSDQYASMIEGGNTFKSNHGSISHMDHNSEEFTKMSKVAQELYYKIRTLGNQGKEYEPYENDPNDEDNHIFKNISGRDLTKVMKLALDMGYNLSDTLHWKLYEKNPKLEITLANYEGVSLTHANYMKADHPYYKHIKKQYLNKYNGDEERATKMTKLFRKEAQQRSKQMKRLP